MTLCHKVLDYLWHMVLPVLSSTVGSLALMTLLTKNSFLEDIRKQYVITARAKGLSDHQVLYGHVFRNAIIPRPYRAGKIMRLTLICGEFPAPRRKIQGFRPARAKALFSCP